MGKGISQKKIDFDKIEITNDFMFGTVMSEPENCKEFLQRILGMEIAELTIAEPQKSMKQGLYSKGIRLDVYVKDMEGNAYDIEMQQIDTGELDLRSRYYHSEMDSHQIAMGQKYVELKQSIVIFVCSFDLFEKNRSIYTFQTICAEDTSIQLQDKRQTIFVNIGGGREGYKKDLTHLLDYFQTSEPTDEYTWKLKKRVKILREDVEWRQIYMTWEMKLDERYDAGLREGRERGMQEGRKAELSTIIHTMYNNGVSVDKIAEMTDHSLEEIKMIIGDE